MVPVGCSKIGELGPGVSLSTCCWLPRCFQFSICQLEAKGWVKSRQAVLHPHPCYSRAESMQGIVPACSGCWGGTGGDPAGLEVGCGAHSIATYVEATGVPNLLPPILLDVSQGWETWGGAQPDTLDLLVSINMMHITELRCTEVSPARAEGGAPGGCPQPPDPVPTSLIPQGLFKGAGVLLKPGGVLFTYGVGHLSWCRSILGVQRVRGDTGGGAGGRAAPVMA